MVIPERMHLKKYRIINDLVQETSLTRDLLHRYGTHLSGVHLETTFHHNVSECVTHECELCPDRAYMSALDPKTESSASQPIC